MTFVSGPSTLLAWLLLASGVAATAVYIVGLQKFFVQAHSPSRHLLLFQEMNVAVVAIHGVGLVSRDPAGEVWAGAGVSMYIFAIVIFLAAIEAARGTPLPRAFVVDRQPDRLITGGVFRLVRHPIYLSYALAWFAGAVATHSPTLTVTAAALVACYGLAAVREDRQLALRFGQGYDRYRWPRR